MPRFKQKVLDLAESRIAGMQKPNAIDRVLAATLLPFIPRSVTPNQLTVFRFLTVPFIIWFLLSEYYVSAAILFAFSALSDALDGALARTSAQITRWGILADPLADKLLIGSIALILISRFLNWQFALLIVAIELFILASAYFRYTGVVMPAKTPGKIKMIFQCIGVMFLFFHVLFGGAWWLFLAWAALTLGVVFALLSLLLYKSI